MNPRRLYRCRHDRMLAGVAGGMAEYLDVDPTVVRVLWILSAFLGGFTILLYLILVFIMPLEPIAAAGYGPMPGAAPGAAGEPGVTPEAEPGTGQPGVEAGATTTGWTTGPSGWVPGGWAAHRHEAARGDRGSGRAGLLIGVVLIVFGSIALLGALLPHWAAIGLGPAFVLALGVALVIASTRRRPSES